MFSKSTQKTGWYDGNLYMHDFHATRQTKEISDRSFWKIIEIMKHVETEKSFIYGISISILKNCLQQISDNHYVILRRSLKVEIQN